MVQDQEGEFAALDHRPEVADPDRDAGIAARPALAEAFVAETLAAPPKLANAASRALVSSLLDGNRLRSRPCSIAVADEVVPFIHSRWHGHIKKSNHHLV